MRIDSHQHFWRYHPVEYNWMTPEMGAIKKDFLPAGLEPILHEQGVDGTVLVQVSQTPDETEFLLNLAEENRFIRGVVGWVDLQAEDIFLRLSYYRSFKKLKGFRHILQLEEPEYMLRPSFLRGIAALQELGFTYDILVYPRHLHAALQLVEKFPDQAFVIDHIAKPFIADGIISGWQEGMAALASHPNLYCKISGMVTEADWKKWSYDDFIPYIDTVLEYFGTQRTMFGSDWPMCLVAASYPEVMGIVRRYFAAFPEAERQSFFGENAARFYQL